MKKAVNVTILLTAINMFAGDYGKIPEQFNPNKVIQRTAVESTPRRGLANFYYKLENGQDVTIAYIGNAVTRPGGFCDGVTRHIQEQYPKSNVKSIVKGLVGTRSLLGALRLQYDILRFKPDLLVIEFNMKDGEIPVIEARKSMEGIVRQLWTANSMADIIFVYTVLMGKELKNLQKGVISKSKCIHEDVADYYGIPSVDMGCEIARLERARKLVMKSPEKRKDGKIGFAPNGWVPYNSTGQKLYAQSIIRALPEMKKSGKATSHLPLPPPMVKGAYDHVITSMIDHKKIQFNGNWEKLSRENPIVKRYQDRAEKFYRFKPGAKISLRFSGEKLFLYYMTGPDCGKFKVRIDNGKEKVLNSFTPWSCHYRLTSMLISDKLPPGEHEITITVLNEKTEKRSILWKHRKNDFDKNPEKFDGLNLYPIALFSVCY